MPDPLFIRSSKGPYEVRFGDGSLAGLGGMRPGGRFFVIDEKVAALYKDALGGIPASGSVLLIKAVEESKSLDRFPAYAERLAAGGARRSDTLVAVGGGITQDIAGFLAAIMFRGMKWELYPTTLLSQVDSCIGGKSSVNVGGFKNLAGSFTPPARVTVCTGFLRTLRVEELRSGAGEILKAYAIAGPDRFDRLAAEYDALLSDFSVMERHIRGALEIKKALVETDEFDTGPRNLLNYGHSFGHALESAADFAVPHGIAVTIGMDMANYAAFRLGFAEEAFYLRMHPVLRRNYAGYERLQAPFERFIEALGRDKKNSATELTLVLPDKTGAIGVRALRCDARFRDICAEYLRSGRTG